MKKYLLHYKYQNTLLVLLLTLQSASLVAASATLALMTNALANQSFRGFLTWISIELACYLLYLVLTYAIGVFQTKLIQLMSLAVREQYIQQITQAPFADFQSKEIGDHLSILNNDIKMIEESGFASFYNLLSTIFTTVFSIVALLSYDYRIVLLTLLLTLALTYLPRPFANKMEQLIGHFSVANEHLISGLTDRLTGYKDLYYANAKSTLSSQVKVIVQTFITQKVDFTKKTTAIEIIMALFSIFGQMSILLLTGFLISLGHISLGTISSVGQISGNIFNSLTTFNQLQVAILSVKPLFAKLEKNSVQTGLPFEDDIERISIQHLDYAFGDKPIFTDFSLDLTQGEKYAIIGESGSGKSTLVNILLGNKKDYTGQLNYNHTELKTIQADSLVSKIAYIGNHTHIFTDTLRNNLTLWNHELSNQEIIDSLERVNLLDLLPRLDDLVSPDLLSEGQKQRIGIARALLSKRPFIIMDEATANLDKTNANRIESSLLDDPSLTYVTITHHLNSDFTTAFNKIIQLGQ